MDPGRLLQLRRRQHPRQRLQGLRPDLALQGGWPFSEAEMALLSLNTDLPRLKKSAEKVKERTLHKVEFRFC